MRSTLRGLGIMFFSAGSILAPSTWATDPSPVVVQKRVPHDGIQPQVVVAANGELHMIYFKGDAAAGDVFYCWAKDSMAEFSDPLRVNSEPNSAIAIGTIRGAHLAVGKGGCVHVSWNGSGKATPKGLANPDLPEDNPYRLSAPMLYSRMEARDKRFEPQRNLMTHTFSLDGGGSVAADSKGNVYVVWHASSVTSEVHGEAGRAIWVAISRDDGMTFAAETRANLRDTGACGCCGLRAFVNQRGDVYVLYRTAENIVNRDMHALVSKDQGIRFASATLDRWEVPQCVMSSAAVAELDNKIIAAWETENQVKFGGIDDLERLDQPRIFGPALINPPQKHPVLATNSQGQILLVWTEGTAWQKGGTIAWQVFNQAGFPLLNATGRIDGLPVWSFAAAFANSDDTFTIVY